MAACKVNSEASPQFRTLRAHWKRNGYPNVDEDLTGAFQAIEQNIQANKASRIQAGPAVEVYKYRQNSKDIKRGARYGWRIIALHHKPTNTMYPILIYPKTEWSDAADSVIAEAIKEIRQILGQCIVAECSGTMITTNPAESRQHGAEVHTKMKCKVCGAIQWISTSVPIANG